VARSPETALIAPNSKTCYISSMKRNFPFSGARRHRSGFSLIELLVVMTIIMILSGIVIGALIKVNKQRDIKQTRVTLRNLALKLEEYASEHNGIYPVGEEASSSILFNALSGDYTGQGQAPTGPIYWKELNDQKNAALVGTLQGKKIILDSFGQSFRYRAALDKNGDLVEEVKNDGDFDLWSVGPDNEPTDLNISGLLENEQTKDDIWR
jgi:prepilin-type N-terminal cleavage/methylation domain-containing protein